MAESSNDEDTSAYCLSCYGDFSEVESFEYNDSPNSEWRKAPYCIECFNHIKSTQFKKYKKSVDTADCVAALRRCVQEGPPVNVRDKGFKCNNENGEVYQYKYNGNIHSAKLEDSIEGEERQKWWDDMKSALAQMEQLDKPTTTTTTTIVPTVEQLLRL